MPNPTQNSLNSGNYCLCCGNRASHCGSFNMDSTGITRSCSREVCVACLEGGCRSADGKGCYGSRLRYPASEYHQGCGCE